MITDKKGKTKALLRFNFMIPVPNACLTRLEIKGNFSDKEAIRIKEELAFCRRNKDLIVRGAKKTYDRINAFISPELNNNSCNFKLLEDAYIIYCHDNGLVLPDVLKERYIEVVKSKNLSKSNLSDNSSPTEITGKPFTITHSQMQKNAANISSNNTRQNVPKKDKKHIL